MFLSLKKIIFISIHFVICCTVSILSQTEFDTKIRVTKWADDKKSAFTFSFDDGLLSHYQHAGPILNLFGFKATFNVMPPFLTETLPGIWRYGTWPMFIQLAQQQHEIASHTMNHYYLTSLPVGDTATQGTALYELYQSKKAIEQRIPDQNCITLAYPYSDRNILIDSLTALFYEAGRSAGLEPNYHTLDSYYDLNSYVVHFSLPRYTLADDLDELYSFMSWTHNSILNEKWAIMMIHEIVPQSELPGLVSQGLYEPISSEWFTYLCDWLKTRSDYKEIWVETTGNIVRYIKQRDNFQYEIVLSTAEEIKINLTDDLDDDIYNYPLSVYVSVPEDWTYVLLTQSNHIDTLTSITTDSGKVVLSKIIPDKGIASLRKINITGIEDEQLQPLAFELYQNFPNPFNPSTIIRYQLSVNSYVTLRVYDMLGKEVAVLVNEEQSAGRYEIEFLSAVGSRQSASGVYFYQLKAGDYTAVKKMILLR